MNVLQLRTGTEEALKCTFTPQKGPWTPSEFLRLLNVHQSKLHTHIAALNEGAFETDAAINETSGVALISLPANLYKLRKLERIIGNGASTTNPLPIEPVQRNVDDELNARAIGDANWVEFYQQRGQKAVVLIPAPTATQTGSLLATYIYTPAALVNDTDVPFQIAAGPGGSGLDNFAEWHDILMLGVIERLLKKNKEFDKAMSYREDRMERLQELSAFLKPMNSQEPRTVRYTGSPHDSVWMD